MSISADVNYIAEKTLKELVNAGPGVHVSLSGRQGGFTVVIRYGEVEKALASRRGEARCFASLNTAVTFLSKIGITQFQVDASGYEPGRLRKPRPDRAEALRKTRTKPKQANLL